MSLSLKVFLIGFAILLFFVTTHILKKGRIPEKYSLLWYFISLIILLVGIVPNFLNIISEKIGFQVLSNMVIGIMLALLTFLTMALTIIVSGQKKKSTLLIQELSLLKAEINQMSYGMNDSKKIIRDK